MYDWIYQPNYAYTPTWSTTTNTVTTTSTSSDYYYNVGWNANVQNWINSWDTMTINYNLNGSVIVEDPPDEIDDITDEDLREFIETCAGASGGTE